MSNVKRTPGRRPLCTGRDGAVGLQRDRRQINAFQQMMSDPFIWQALQNPDSELAVNLQELLDAMRAGLREVGARLASEGFEPPMTPEHWERLARVVEKDPAGMTWADIYAWAMAWAERQRVIDRRRPIWERLTVSNDGGLAILDGQAHRLSGEKCGPFLRLLIEAKGEPIPATMIENETGERPNRTMKRLPEAIRRHVEGPEHGRSGTRLV